MARARRSGAAARLAVGCIVVAVAARVSVDIPGSPVPQSLQTLAVVLVGAWLGAGAGAAALLVYLIAGGLGAPVFADGAAGWGHLVGPTAGYLAGFLLAAALTGRGREKGLLRRPGPAFGFMAIAHMLILCAGWTRLSLTLGPGAAWETGVSPFLTGGIAKSIFAALVVVAFQRLRPAPEESPPPTSSES